MDARALLFSATSYALNPLESKVFLLCDQARSASAVAAELPNATLEDVTKVLDGFCDKGVMWSDGTQYLALAVSFTEFLASRASTKLENAIEHMLSEQVPS